MSNRGERRAVLELLVRANAGKVQGLVTRQFNFTPAEARAFLERSHPELRTDPRAAQRFRDHFRRLADAGLITQRTDSLRHEFRGPKFQRRRPYWPTPAGAAAVRLYARTP